MNKIFFLITSVLAISNISMFAETTEPPRITDPEQLEAIAEATVGNLFSRDAAKLILINSAKDGHLHQLQPSLSLVLEDGALCHRYSRSRGQLSKLTYQEIKDIVNKMMNNQDGPIQEAFKYQVELHYWSPF